MTRRNGRRSANRGDHRQPRAQATHGPRLSIASKKLTLCLWSAGGALVRRVDAFGPIAKAPSFSVWEGLRYDRMNAQPSTFGIVHYRASVIERKAAG